MVQTYYKYKQNNLNCQAMRISKHIAVFLALIALANTIVLTILFKDQLQKLGINFILSYQANQTSSFVTVVMNIISLFGSVIASVGFVALVHVFFYRKLNTLTYLAYILFNAYMIGLTKQLFQQARPFAQEPQVEVRDWICETTYGMPSGHAWISVLVYQPVISDMIGTKGLKHLLLIWPVLTGALIPLSRQYLGSHTSDQVMFGTVCTFVFLVLYRYRIRELLYRLMGYTLQGNRRGLICFLNTLAFCSIFIVPFIFFEVNMKYRPFPQQQIDRVNQKCNRDDTFRDLQVKAGVESSIFGIAFGIIYGLLISSLPSFRSRFFQKEKNGIITNQLYYYLVGSWNFGGKKTNGLKYLLVYAIFAVVFLLLLANIAGPAIYQFQVRYIFQAVSYAVFGIATTSFIPAILFKWGAFEIHPYIQSETNIGTDQHLRNKQDLNQQIGQQQNRAPLYPNTQYNP